MHHVFVHLRAFLLHLGTIQIVYKGLIYLLEYKIGLYNPQHPGHSNITALMGPSGMESEYLLPVCMSRTVRPVRVSVKNLLWLKDKDGLRVLCCGWGLVETTSILLSSLNIC